MGILTKAFGYFSRPVSLLDPMAGRYLSDYGASSDAGPSVTLSTALQLSTVWACVRLISSILAGLPIGIYDEDADGNKVLDRSHPLHELLRHQPNADMTAFEFWEAMIACLLLLGNAYAEKTVNVIGATSALTPLAPDRVRPCRDSDGTIYFLFNDYFGKQRRLEEDQVFHLKGFSLNGLLGMSVIGAARNSMGSALATDQAAAAMFANGLRPSYQYSVPNILEKPQRERLRELLAELSGNAKRGGYMLLEGGVKGEALEIPPEDAQMLETRGFNVEEICRWFNTPPVMIGHAGPASSNDVGLEQRMIQFTTTTLKPHTDRICGAIRKSLLKPAERVGVVAQYDFGDILRADSAARAALIGVFAQNGVRTRNELRAMDGLGPRAGGDDLTVQSNLIPLDKVGTTAPAQTPAGFGHAPSPQDKQKDAPHAQ